MTSKLRHLHDLQNLESFGNLKNSIDTYGKYSHENTKNEKLEHESAYEINIYEPINLTERESKGPNYDLVSSSDCVTTEANNLKQTRSAVSTSRRSTVEVGICKKGGTEGISGDMHCNNLFTSSIFGNPLTGNENSNNSETSAQSIGGIESVQQILITSCIKLDCDWPFKNEVNELDLGRRKGNMPKTDEDVLKSIMQTSIHDKQLKTESSSSNSSHVFLPTSSNDSCQETIPVLKSSKHCKSSDMSNICSPFKCSLEDPAGKTMVLGTKGQVSCREVLDSSIFLPRIQENSSKTLETDGSICERVGEQVLGMIEDLMVRRIGVPNSSLLKTENEELTCQEKLELPCEVDDGLEVASAVARETELEVSTYREVFQSSFCTEGKTGDTVNLDSRNSSYQDKKDDLLEPEPRSKSYKAKSKSENLCPIKLDGECPEFPMKNQQLCIEVKEQSAAMSLGKHRGNNGFYNQGTSLLTTRKDVVADGFDLNECVVADEVECPKQLVNETSFYCHAVNVSMPIPVVAKSRIPLSLPMPPLQFEGELCWKGASATSAFRPASISTSCNKRKAPSYCDGNHSSIYSPGFKGFDLNVAAVESSLQDSSKRAERPNLDLNCLSEDNCESSPLVSVPRTYIRDIDLNHNQWFDDTCKDDQGSVLGCRLMRSSAMDPAIPCSANVGEAGASGVKPAQPAYRADVNCKQGSSNGPAQTYLMAAPGVISSLENMRMLVTLQTNMSYSPLGHPFSYNKGFYFDPTNPLATMCMTDPHGNAFVPQALVSSTSPVFPMASHLVNVGGPSPCNMAIIRPSLDLNCGIAPPENVSRGRNAAQLFGPVGNSLVQEQMKSFQQFVMPAKPIKREPDDGWDSHNLGYRQVTSNQ